MLDRLRARRRAGWRELSLEISAAIDGVHPNRPAHMHSMVTAAGFQKLVKHTFVGDDPYLGSDTMFGVKQTLVAPSQSMKGRLPGARPQISC